MGWISLHGIGEYEPTDLDHSTAGQVLQLPPASGHGRTRVAISTPASFSQYMDLQCNSNTGFSCGWFSSCEDADVKDAHELQCVKNQCLCAPEKPCFRGNVCTPQKCETQVAQVVAEKSAGGPGAPGAVDAALAAGAAVEDEDMIATAAGGGLQGMNVPEGEIAHMLHQGNFGKANIDRRVVVTLPGGGISGNTPVLVDGNDTKNPFMAKANGALITMLEKMSRKLRAMGQAETDEIPKEHIPGDMEGGMEHGKGGLEPEIGGSDIVPSGNGSEGSSWSLFGMGAMPEDAIWAATFGPARPTFNLVAGQSSRHVAAEWSSFFPHVLLAPSGSFAEQQQKRGDSQSDASEMH